MTFDTIKHFLTSFSADAAILAIIELLKTAHEKATPADIRKIRFQMFGDISPIDEQMYDQAEGRLEPVLVAKLRARLRASLKPHMQDYFRIITLGNFDPDDKAEVAAALDRMEASLRRHAAESDTAWADYVVIMNLDKKKAASRTEQLFKGIKNTGKAIAAKYTDTGDQWEATGVNKALNKLNNSFLKRIKKNLS